jgi:hypothetical protein
MMHLYRYKEGPRYGFLEESSPKQTGYNNFYMEYIISVPDC